MKSKLVISHGNCDDGMGAALAAYLKLGDSADYWFAHYGSKPPYEKINKDVEVFIFDFTYEHEDLIKIKDKAKSLIVIDHHKGAEDKFKGLDFCVFDMTKSGAVLAWEYFFDTPYNQMFMHLQDYDLWKFECPNTKYFSRALRSYPQDLKTWVSFYNSFENDDSNHTFYKKFIEEGKSIERYFTQQLESNIKSNKMPITLNGINGLCCNLPGMFASEGGNILAKESGTFGMTWFVHGQGNVKCSIRSIGDSCNTILIAEKFGGGGHINSSGFSFPSLQHFYELITKGT